MEITRRALIKQVGLLGAGLFSGGFMWRTPTWAKDTGQVKAKAEEEVTPAENLIREHGALEQVLLIYEESSHHIANYLELPLEALVLQPD